MECERIRSALGPNGRHGRRAIDGRRMIITDRGPAWHGRSGPHGATLAETFQRLTRVMDPEDGRGHGDLTVRLHAEERDRDWGMSW